MFRSSSRIGAAAVIALGSAAAMTGVATATAGVGTPSSPPSIQAGLMNLDQGSVFYGDGQCPGGQNCTYSGPSLAAAHFSDGSTWMYRSIGENKGDNSDPATKHTEYMRAQVSSSGAPLNWSAFTVSGVNSTYSNLAFVGNFAQVNDMVYMFGGYAHAASQQPSGAHEFIVPRYVSSSQGAHFIQPSSPMPGVGSGWGAIFLPESALTKNIAVAYQGIKTLLDGTWIMPVYASNNVYLVKSTDQGQTWTTVTTVFISGSPAGTAYTEAAVNQLPNGHLVMVVRDEVYNAANSPGTCADPAATSPCGKLGYLYFRQTTGPAIKTESQLASLNDSDTNTFNPDAWSAEYTAHSSSGQPAVTYGSSPVLTRAGKYLMMAYGRPGEHVSFSADGYTWSTPGAGFFSNRPTNIDSCQGDTTHIPCLAVGAQGYLGLAAVDSDYDSSGPYAHGYVAFDSCGPWSCNPAYTPGTWSYPMGTTPRVTIMRWTMTTH